MIADYESTVETITIIPVDVVLTVTPNSYYYKTKTVKDEGSPDGFYLMTVKKKLKTPNVFVLNKIKCNNSFRTNSIYAANTGVKYMAISEDCLVNLDTTMDKFEFPKQVVYVGSAFSSCVNNANC